MLGSRLVWVNEVGVDQGVLEGACRPVVLVTARVVVTASGTDGVRLDVGVGGFKMSRVGVASGDHWSNRCWWGILGC